MATQAKQTRRRLQDLEVLYKISNIITTTQDAGKVLRAILKEVVRITGATSGSIAILDEKRGVLDIESAINIPTQTWRRLKLQLGVGVTGWAAFKGISVRVDDVRSDSHYVSVKPDIRSELAVPMLLKGRVIGVINVDSTRRGAFTGDDERLLTAIAEQSSRIFETARLYDRTRVHAEHLEGLFAFSRRLVSQTPPSAILRNGATEARKLLEADCCVFLEVRENGALLVPLAQSGDPWDFCGSEPMQTAKSLLAPVVNRAQAMIVPDVMKRRSFWHEGVRDTGRIASLLAVPIVFQERTQGIFVALTAQPRDFSESDARLLELLANQVAVALDNARRRDHMLQMEETLHRAERFSLLGTLAAEIAHEIRNPVTIINLLMESVVEATAGNEQTSNDVAIIREKLDRIERIVDQTLSTARDRDPNREPVDVNALVVDMLAFMNYRLVKGSVEVKTSLADDLPILQIDRGHAQQVLLNLVMNSLEAMSGGGKLTVRTQRVEDGRLGPAVCVTIKDTGPGIPKEHLDQLFDPFFTTRAEGTGLGLFISRRLVAAHNGDIRARSRSGGGASFDILLPIAAEPKPPNGPAA